MEEIIYFLDYLFDLKRWSFVEIILESLYAVYFKPPPFIEKNWKTFYHSKKDQCYETTHPPKKLFDIPSLLDRF